mmetsp:Transcript_89501/g.158883  ORF Transcript_89501/g.158883 Transcript_89501/m.158883 type:complete len:312 (-) Transcript_89501:184-1119(-)
MSGPMGGIAGMVRQKPVSNRRMPTRGFKMGSYVKICYRCSGKHGGEEDNADYEGKLVDKRIGGEDRESYVTLKDCLMFDLDGNFLEKLKSKKLVDAYVETCELADKRSKTPEREAPAAGATGGTAGQGFLPFNPPGQPQATETSGQEEKDDDSDDDDAPAKPGMMPGMMQQGSCMPGMTPGATSPAMQGGCAPPQGGCAPPAQGGCAPQMPGGCAPPQQGGCAPPMVPPPPGRPPLPPPGQGGCAVPGQGGCAPPMQACGGMPMMQNMQTMPGGTPMMGCGCGMGMPTMGGCTAPAMSKNGSARERSRSRG